MLAAFASLFRKGENGAVGNRDMVGKAARVAVERCGTQSRYN